MFEQNMFDTERLHLRPFERDELTAFTDMATDLEVQKYFFEGSSVSLVNIQFFFDCVVSKNHEYDLNFAITLKASGQIIGYIRLCTLFGNILIIEYIIKNEFRGKKYAQEALKAVLDYVKKFKPNISTLYFKVHNENIASLRVLEKLGAKKILIDQTYFELSLDV